MASQPASKEDAILIVGAGVFGLSTAFELTKRGYRNVTVLDRHLPPVPDGSSVDISRIIRTDYGDSLYARMANEAFTEWTGEYSDYYYHTGYIMIYDRGSTYMKKVIEVNQDLGVPLDEYDDAQSLRETYTTVQADLEGMQARGNRRGGWANAEGAIRFLAAKCALAGVSFVTGNRGTVVSLRRDGSKVTGVKVRSGDVFDAAHVILATGAWTNRLLNICHATTASGQPVGFIQLTPEEAESIRDTPILINLSSGVFFFPPTPGSNVLKVARHGFGYATRVEVDNGTRTISCPSRDRNNASSGYLPPDADKGLRDGLRQLLPKFADHPWLNRRLCWYSDTQEGHFVVDQHPDVQGLFVATGGAGHGFKFLPVLGRYIADCFENKASDEVRQKWRLRRAPANAASSNLSMKGDGSRGGPPLQILTNEERSKL